MKNHFKTRAVCVFLAGYVLLMSLMPCMDVVISQGSGTTFAGASLSNPGHADHRDCCSPFCSCTCCNVAMEVTPGVAISGLGLLPQKFIFPVDLHLLSDYSFVAWEPPKA